MIAIAYQVARRRIPGVRLAELLCRARRGRVSDDREVDDSSDPSDENASITASDAARN
jgi:hypothetical protein